MTKMISYGMPGVWTHAFVDMWSPGYLGFMSSNHNGMLRMYETFGNGGANTMRRTIGGAAWRRRRAGALLPRPRLRLRRRPMARADAADAGGRGGRGGGSGCGGRSRGGRGGGMTAREWYRPLPPPRDLTWSMRNNTNYMETGSALGFGIDGQHSPRRCWRIST